MSSRKYTYNLVICLIVILAFLGCLQQEPISNTENTVQEVNITLIEDIEKQRSQFSTQVLARKKHIDSVNADLQWKVLSCGLYINKREDIGFKTIVFLEKGIYVTQYICEFNGMEERKVLKSVIDTASFQYLGNSFYKDQHYIYQYFEMKDGGFFTIFPNVDYPTFQVIGDCFAKDKNHVYSERSGIIKSADAQTFHTEPGIGCFAKDKNGYFFWNTPIKIKDMDTEIVRKLDETFSF